MTVPPPGSPPPAAPPPTDVSAQGPTPDGARRSLAALRTEVGKAVVGQDAAVTGLLIALLGGILVWRSLRRAHAVGWTARNNVDTVLVPASRFALAASMFFVYSLLLVGRGLPFWLGTGLFVTAFVWVFRRADRASGAGAGPLTVTDSGSRSRIARARVSAQN